MRIKTAFQQRFSDIKDPENMDTKRGGEKYDIFKGVGLFRDWFRSTPEGSLKRCQSYSSISINSHKDISLHTNRIKK